MERVYLDPTELAGGSRAELEITDWIAADGVDWGDALVEADMAEQQVGASPVDYSIPNRTVQIPLVLKTVGGTAFASIRSAVQARAGLYQSQGGWLKRVLGSGGTVFADVVNAQLRLGGNWLQSHGNADPEASLTLECLPDFYESEEELSDHTETTAAELIFTETTANGGDFPLGDRVRIVVDEDDGDNQRGLIWSIRGRHYSSATTAASEYEAEELEALDTATKVAKVGASGGTVVTHGTVSTSWTPVVGTNIGGTSYLTHTGTNRVYARVFSASGTAVDARLVYDVGDLVNPIENEARTLYDGGTFHILDLGEARLDPPPVGTHRWQGQVQARGQAGTESFSVDKVWIVNQDESAGVLQAPILAPSNFTAFTARSNFTTESGAITGDSLEVGGTWQGAGDTDDFSVAGGMATRTAVSDTAGGPQNGRLIGPSAATAMTNTVIQVDYRYSAREEAEALLLARYASTSAFFVARLKGLGTGGNGPTATVSTMIGGSLTDIATTELGSSDAPLDTWLTLRLVVYSGGGWQFSLGPQGAPAVILEGYSAALITGGSLASGQPRIGDYQTDASANTRDFDNFSVWVPSQDAVVFANQSVELSTQGIIREDSGGTAYGPVSVVSGDLPRMPNQSSAGTVEFLAKASRGDLSTLPDPAIDDISARVYRRASWLTGS